MTRWRKWHICALAKIYIECTTDHTPGIIQYGTMTNLSKANYELEEMGLITIQAASVYGYYATSLTDEGKRIFESISVAQVMSTLDEFGWIIAVKCQIQRCSKAELGTYLVHKSDFYRNAALERYEELCSCDCQIPT